LANEGLTGLARASCRRTALMIGVICLSAVVLSGCNSLLGGLGGGGKGAAGAIVNQAGAAPSAGSLSSQEHARIVATYGGIYRDKRVEEMLAKVVTRLVEASDDPKRTYRVTILNAPAVNAFALPSGDLYVTRGLLALASDASEVAAVMAHEMAHVTANHAAQREQRARTAIIVSRAVTDALADGSAGQLALASGQRTLASFSRQQELEADAIGVRTAAKAGYDPMAASRFLATMSHYANYRGSLAAVQDRRPDFLSNHPSTPERVEFARQAAVQAETRGKGETDRGAYLAAIDGVIFGDDTGQGYVRGRNFYHAGLKLGFTVPEGFVLDNTTEAVLATGPDGTALRFDAVTLPESMPLEAYLSSGWINGLDRSSIAAFDTNGLSAASALAHAKGWVFRITVVRIGDTGTYRFIFANESDSPAFAEAERQTVSSFRMLTREEVADLKPLRVKVVTVGFRDDEERLVRRMRGVDKPLQLFRVLNDFDPEVGLRTGSKVKIVAD
jgi:predicted Zn-dependent protease